jgi:hypothetical protein
METVVRNHFVSRNQSLRGNVFVNSFPRNGPHVTISYLIKLCGMQAEVILNHRNPIYVVLDKGKPCTGSTRGLNLAAVKPTTVQLTSSVSEWLN